MDLHSGLPYWLIKNELFNYYNPLNENYKIDVVVIGSGITGALVAHELCRAGIPCAVFDKRTIATGSTVASTAQLQYEIDVPLSKMIKITGEERAVKAYHASLKSIADIGGILKETRIKADFRTVSSIWLASYKKDIKLLEEEFETRQKHNLPVEFMDAGELLKTHGIEGNGALKNYEAAQMDAYAAATGLLNFHLKRKELDLFSPVEITKWKEMKSGYELETHNGFKVRCKYLVVAAGFESGQFLPKKMMNLVSTYALVSQPVHENQLWPERSLIWETKDRYFYMRTTLDNRMVIGGEDEVFQDPVRRDKLLRQKIKKLEKEFQKVYPEIPFKTDMAWCGTFSSTEDGLPYIGTWPGKDRMFFALGYGGNGITFSTISAQVIKNKLVGINDERAEIFGFDR